MRTFEIIGAGVLQAGCLCRASRAYSVRALKAQILQPEERVL